LNTLCALELVHVIMYMYLYAQTPHKYSNVWTVAFQ